MAAKKATAPKRKVQKKTDNKSVLFEQVETVDITDLKPHPKNPNIGDVDSIVESIQENGVAQPIVANRRNMTIVGGHHTWLALRKMGYDTAPVVFVDIDDTRHLKLMLALNRTADKRTYDETLLLDIMRSLPDITGTGYTELDVEDMAARASEMVAGALGDLSKAEEDQRRADEAVRTSKTFAGSPLGEEPDDFDDDDEGAGVTDAGEVKPRQVDQLQTQKDELSGAFTLKEDMAFDGVGPWGIPRMRTDMLMTWDELPTNLETWAGSATKDWEDEDTWWLYNWAIDSTSGMKDISKVIIGFYCHDEYFENWWWHASKYVAKVLNSGIKYIVMPDFSMHTVNEESRVLSLWSFYRSRWLARYFQECGLKLIPEVTWNAEDPDFLEKFILATTPKKIPLLCLQVQTIDKKNPLYDKWIAQVQTILDTIKPEALLIYHGKQGEEIFTDGTIKFKGNIKLLQSRMYRLSEKAKKKSKKKTI